MLYRPARDRDHGQPGQATPGRQGAEILTEKTGGTPWKAQRARGDRQEGHLTPINCKETKYVAKEIALWAPENGNNLSAELTVGRRSSGVGWSVNTD